MKKKSMFPAWALPLFLAGTVGAADLPSYSAIDGVHFNDPSVSCEGLHNEDDCHIWRTQNSFEEKWTNYDPCGNLSEETTNQLASGDAQQLEHLRKKALSAKPAAGSSH